MKKFNENPFKKTTPVRPFSNGSEFMDWHGRNCDKCIYYENESTSPEDARCELAYCMDVAAGITGEVPLWVAREVGCDYNPLYCSVRMWMHCSKIKLTEEHF